MSHKQKIVNFAVNWFADELLILESADYFITPNQLCHRQIDICFKRNYASSSIPVYKAMSIRHIFNMASKTIWPIGLVPPIQGELKIAAFGREYLFFQLTGGVESFSLVVFVNAFGLYQNSYWSLTGVYALPVGLSSLERQKSHNCYTLTLGPHGSDFNSVIGGLHTGLKALDRGCVLQINRSPKLI